MLHRDIEDVHAEACYRGDSTYIDPETGYSVFTSVGLMKKKTCCGSGCRHCPYGRMNCDPGRAHTDTTPLEYIKSNGIQDGRETAVVFFSGGKDSFLAVELARQEGYAVVLLTTYDPRLQMNGIQKVPIDCIREFASVHHLDLVTVPVSTHSTLPYTDMVHKGLQLILSSKPTTHIARVVFGDIHLEHIKQWRLNEISKRLGYDCWFPLWNKPYDALMKTLHSACQEYQVTFLFSAIYDDTLRDRLQFEKESTPNYFESIDILAELGIDQFGEHGEFHTMISLVGSQ